MCPFLSPYIYSIPYQYMFCQVLTVNGPKFFTVCTNSTFCNFLCLKCLFVRQKMPLPELFGGILCKTEKIGLLFCARCQPEDQRQFHFASWYKPLYSSLRSLTNGLYCKERSLTTVILQWFDVNRPLYYNGLTLTKELFVEPSNSCLLSLGSRQLQWHTQ